MHKKGDFMVKVVQEAYAVVRGRRVKFAAKRLGDGSTALYRSGKRAKSPYQKRVAKGVLEGKTIAEATGRKTSIKMWREKYWGRPEIDERLAKYINGRAVYGTTSEGHVLWAVPPETPEGALERHRYYALVNIQVASAQEAGSDIAHDDGASCVPATVALFKNRNNDLTGLTRAEFRRDFEKLLYENLRRMRLRLCTGDAKVDVLGIWRHKTK
jgi:hypothetical protein